MTPRDIFNTRAERASLRIDPTSYHASDASATPSPRASATSQSPNTPISSARPSPSGSDTPDAEEEKEKEPASGPTRSTSTTNGTKSERERRKRSRVTPDQLVHLEQFFSVERSPTATRRKEISEMLGMEERQTQVWFQNRRAKAKLLQLKKKEQRPRAQSAPEVPLVLSKDRQADLLALIHEHAPVTIIPCIDLSIGTWRRIASNTGKNDLVAYVCEQKHFLAWFVLSAGIGFKMEIPFDLVTATQFTNAGPGTALATLTLSKAPKFFMESTSGNTRSWTPSGDWTEGSQATHSLRHNIIGGAVQLAHLVQNLRERNHSADVYLHSPTYADRGPQHMEIPRPPMEGLLAQSIHFKTEASTYHGHSPERHPPSYHSRPPPLSLSGYSGHRPSHLSRSVSSISLTPSTFSEPHPHSHVDPGFGSSYHYSDLSPIADGKHDMLSEYANLVPTLSQAVPGSAPATSSSQTYLAQPAPRAFYREGSQFASHYGRHTVDDAHMVPAHGNYEAPMSPPILTTPFHPPPHLVQGYSTSSLMPGYQGHPAPQ